MNSRDPERWALMWAIDTAFVRHAQWLRGASVGGVCGVHRAECLERAAAARRRLAAALAMLRCTEERQGRARRAARRRTG
jgi:hypothetical protein